MDLPPVRSEVADPCCGGGLPVSPRGREALACFRKGDSANPREPSPSLSPNVVTESASSRGLGPRPWTDRLVGLEKVALRRVQ
jgi:hypothetical protein